jgi:hypothetical protein
VALRPCSMCGERVPGKLASCYWAWSLADHSRYAAVQRLCFACLVANVLPLADGQEEDWLNCPVCHTNETENMDPVFLKLYIPGQPERSFEWPTGPVCAVEIRSRAIVGAEDLPDRQVEVGGLAPKPPVRTSWDELGLAPR